MVTIKSQEEMSKGICKEIMSFVAHSLFVYHYRFRVGYDDDCIDEVKQYFSSLGFYVRIDDREENSYCPQTRRTERYITLMVSKSNSILI